MFISKCCFLNLDIGFDFLASLYLFRWVLKFSLLVEKMFWVQRYVMLLREKNMFKKQLQGQFLLEKLTRLKIQVIQYVCLFSAHTALPVILEVSIFTWRTDPMLFLDVSILWTEPRHRTLVVVKKGHEYF